MTKEYVKRDIVYVNPNIGKPKVCYKCGKSDGTLDPIGWGFYVHPECRTERPWPKGVTQPKYYPGFYAGERQPWAKTIVYGNLVFCSGMSGRLNETGKVREGFEDDAAAQTVDAMDKIKAMLEEAGTCLENIVKWTLYMKDVQKDREAASFVFFNYFREHAPWLFEHMPTGTLVGVTSLAFPNFLVEIDVTAIIPS